MQSRLETLDPELSHQITSSALKEAEDQVLSILRKGLTSLPENVRGLLPETFEIHSITISQSQIDDLDNHYFAAQEAGEDETAQASFGAARFLSAVRLWQIAKNQFEHCEAVYEAHFILDQYRPSIL